MPEFDNMYPGMHGIGRGLDWRRSQVLLPEAVVLRDRIKHACKKRKIKQWGWLAEAVEARLGSEYDLPLEKLKGVYEEVWEEYRQKHRLREGVYRGVRRPLTDAEKQRWVDHRRGMGYRYEDRRGRYSMEVMRLFSNLFYKIDEGVVLRMRAILSAWTHTVPITLERWLTEAVEDQLTREGIG